MSALSVASDAVQHYLHMHLLERDEPIEAVQISCRKGDRNFLVKTKSGKEIEVEYNTLTRQGRLLAENNRINFSSNFMGTITIER
jgi:hypothetical protein